MTTPTDQTKPTPGPWKMVKPQPRDIKIDLCADDPESGLTIATVPLTGRRRTELNHPTREITRAQGEANARLIAAAPRLRDALQRADWLLRQIVGNRTDPESYKVDWDSIDGQELAAIAAALKEAGVE